MYSCYQLKLLIKKPAYIVATGTKTLKPGQSSNAMFLLSKQCYSSAMQTIT